MKFQYEQDSTPQCWCIKANSYFVNKKKVIIIINKNLFASVLITLLCITNDKTCSFSWYEMKKNFVPQIKCNLHKKRNGEKHFSPASKWWAYFKACYPVSCLCFGSSEPSFSHSIAYPFTILILIARSLSIPSTQYNQNVHIQIMTVLCIKAAV